MMRVADYVKEIGRVTWDLSSTWLTADRADDLVRALPLLRRLEQWRRVRRFPIVREVEGILLGGERLALWKGTRSNDSDVRSESCRLLLADLDDPRALAPILEAALDDPNPGTRRWAARHVLTSSELVPDDRRRLTSRIAVDHSPWVRLLGLERAIAEGAWPAVLDAMLDPSSLLRFKAREALRETSAAAEVRPRALAVLARGDAAVQLLIGALGALSEVARREDIPRIEAMLRHPSARVAAEARRTRSLLGE